MARLEIFDNGRQAYVGYRFVVLIDGSIFEMNLRPRHPQGVNQYCGPITSKLNRKALGRKVRLSDVPTEVQQAILKRMT